MLKKYLLPSLIASSLVLATGCQNMSAEAYIEVERTRTNPDGSVDKVKAGGRAGTSPEGGSSLLRNVTELVASVTGYSISDWQGMNISDYEIELNGSFGVTSSVIGNMANVMVYQDGNLISTNQFSITQIGDKVRFTNPDSVKTWSYQFIDVANSFEVEIETKTVNATSRPGSVSVKAKQSNNVISSTTIYANAGAACQPGGDVVVRCN